MFDIEKFVDNHTSTQEEERKSRRKGSGGTAEFFTPYRIVEKLCNNIPSEIWADPTKTFVEPCFGSGNILLVILYKRIAEYNIPWKTALQTLYGLELMHDNVQEARDRVHALLRQISPNSGSQAYVKSEADSIMDHNFVCHDFFTWDFINWREMTPDEIQEIAKKNKKKKRK